MAKRDYIFTLIIASLLLFPTLFYHISSDTAIFMTGGKTIAEGGKIYVDYIDIKPPLIYYLFSVIYMIFSDSEFSIRIFDIIMQLATILLIVNTVDKYSKNKVAAMGSGILYALTYMSLNFSQTSQSESFTVIPSILILMLQLSGKNKFGIQLLKGVLIGVLFGIKYTLGIWLLIIFLDDLLRSRYSIIVSIRRLAFTAAGFLSFTALTFLPFLDHQIWEGYKVQWEYLSFYAGKPGMDIGLIRHSLKLLAEFFGDKYSIFMVFLVLFGFGFIFRKSDNEERSHMLKLSFLAALLLLFSIAVERKFHVYHYIRMFVPLSILAGFGFTLVWEKLKRSWQNTAAYGKLLIIGLAGLAILFSPVPRFVNLLQVPVYYFADQAKYLNFFNRGDGVLVWNQYIEIADFINKNAAPEDDVILISTGHRQINLMLDDVDKTRLAQSCFFFATKDIPKWRKIITEEIKTGEWVIIAKTDRHLHLTGTGKSSWEAIKDYPEMYNALLNRYELAKETKDFLIFRVKEGNH